MRMFGLLPRGLRKIFAEASHHACILPKVPPPESAPGREHPEVQPREGVARGHSRAGGRGLPHAALPPVGSRGFADIPVRAARGLPPLPLEATTANHSTYSTFSTRLNLSHAERPPNPVNPV